MSKWLLVCCASLMFAGRARADNKPTADEQKRYAVALKRARHAEDAGQLAAAAKGLEDCLQIPRKKFADLLEALKPGTFELVFP